MINLSYSPTLSSMEINISPRSKIFLQILEEFAKLKHPSKENEVFLQKVLEYYKENSFDSETTEDFSKIPEEILNKSYERYLAEGNNLKLIVRHNSIKFEFFEIRPPHSREILITQIEDLLNSFELLKRIHISDLMNDSYFSVLYNPFKSTKALMMTSSFLVYHKINLDEDKFIESNKFFLEIPVMGILPIKFDNKMFLNTINRKKDMNNIISRSIKMMNASYVQSNMNTNNHYSLVKNLIVKYIFDKF